jgi:hypothetical protein
LAEASAQGGARFREAQIALKATEKTQDILNTTLALGVPALVEKTLHTFADATRQRRYGSA